MEKNFIVEKILKDTKRAEAEVLKSAEETASERRKRVEEALAKEKAEAESRLETKMLVAERNRRTGEELAKRQAVLIRQHAAMDKVFDKAAERIAKFSPADRAKLVASLKKQYAKTGDKVEEVGGGIVISNSRYDINLTAPELLKSLRDEIQLQVVEVLGA